MIRTLTAPSGEEEVGRETRPPLLSKMPLVRLFYQAGIPNSIFARRKSTFQITLAPFPQNKNVGETTMSLLVHPFPKRGMDRSGGGHRIRNGPKALFWNIFWKFREQVAKPFFLQSYFLLDKIFGNGAICAVSEMFSVPKVLKRNAPLVSKKVKHFRGW